MNDEADEVVKELFDSLKNRYQNNLELMKGSEFVFDYVHLLYYICHSCESYIDSPDWTKNKKATIQPINTKDDRCFQYAVTDVLKHEKRKKYLQRTTKIKTFINKYNWEGLNFPSEKDDCKFKKNKKYNCSGAPAFKSQRAEYQSNQKLLHNYQH